MNDHVEHTHTHSDRRRYLKKKPLPEALAVFRRSLEDGLVKVFLTNAPKRAAKRMLARVGGQQV